MHFWLFLGRNVLIVKLQGIRIVFRCQVTLQCQVLPYVCVLALSIIQEIGNIKR